MLKRKKRIPWIDVYKGILIILVVVGHATGKFNFWIYQFHMAAFFLISGYLSNIEEKNEIIFIVKKFLSILLPYFSLGIAGIIFNAILDCLGYHEILFGSDFIGIKNAIVQMALKGNMYVQYWGTFWFFTTLFSVEILQIFLLRFNNKKINLYYAIVTVGLFFAGYVFVKNNIRLDIWLIQVDLLLIAQLYFSVGLVLKKLIFIHMLRKTQAI